jgi:teichuronic acid biosynthesis glycosyltransferase TuaC
LKVIQLVSSFIPYSSVTSDFLNISRELIKLGHDVSIYTTFSEERTKVVKEEIVEGITVKRFPVTFQYKRFRLSLPFLRYINRMDGDLVHVHECRGFEQTIIAPLLKKVKKIPLILSPYGSVPYECSYSLEHKFMKIFLDKITQKSVFRLADIVLGETNFEKDKLVDFGVPAKKIRLIYENVDVHVFKKAKNSFFNRASRFVLYVGRINKIKNLDFLIRVFYVVRKIHQIDVKLMMVGPFEDRGYLAGLKRLVRELDLKDHIIFHGPVAYEKLPMVYSLADVLVLPSVYENIGGVLVEAQACECPVIVTNVGGMSEVMLDGKTGFIVELGDIDGAAEKIAFLLQNEQKRQEFGRNARDFIFQNFSKEKYVQRILNAYNEALKQSD